ncbi:putative heavy metal-associated domain, HMA, heavy metal-associated domain superfamily [Helianthus annuus]|uniref:Heavy metal-associated domain, HMA, heavy metal-associated domain superfamily n=1 Tax=Helianthus annuus TaxID=4232 RepID=A0A251S112_HELAN|nr:heavy metal-associated isoprenylated plant protein 39 [Helianthus annuus]KAF5819027.1 putative heavy metal-associated domain, HMA, heavy metal-associated domain superfamily [Helianthus annuus]
MPESVKVVMKLNIHDNECKRKILKAVSGLLGIDSLAFEMKDNTLTIVGDVDAVKITNKLKKWNAFIHTLGPAKEPEKKEPEKKGGEDEEAKKKKQEEEEAIKRLIEAYCCSRGDHSYPTQRLCIHAVEEAPTGCVIC